MHYYGSDGESSLSSVGTTIHEEGTPATDVNDVCTVCQTSEGPSSWTKSQTTSTLSWIECSTCKRYLHTLCAGLDSDVEHLKSIAVYNCQQCRQTHSADGGSLQAITHCKSASADSRRKSLRNATASHISYSNLNQGIGHDPERWPKFLASKQYGQHSFPVMPAKDINLAWVISDPEAFKVPIVVMADYQNGQNRHAHQENVNVPSGTNGQEDEASEQTVIRDWTSTHNSNRSVADLGMKMPDQSITVGDIAAMVGEDLKVEVIDVASQSEKGNWDMAKWAKYYMDPKKDSIRNVISLEVSDSSLMDHIERPSLVRQLDWIEQAWPEERKAIGDYPRVQVYCLMGVQKSYTDWHIDFAGSSVFYHIIKGGKTFWFIEPTPENLLAYERWSSTENQDETWLGEYVSEVQEVHLSAGMTMIIPSAWIHCVFTPKDAIVIGGNFIHSLNIKEQFAAYDIEERTNVLAKHRFPHFWELCWYVVEQARQTLLSVSSEAPSRAECQTKPNESFALITQSKRGKDNLRSLLVRLTSEIGDAKSLAPCQIGKSIEHCRQRFGLAAVQMGIKNCLDHHGRRDMFPSAERRSQAYKGLPKAPTFDGLTLVVELTELLTQDLPDFEKTSYIANIVGVLFSKLDIDGKTSRRLRKWLPEMQLDVCKGASKRRRSISPDLKLASQKSSSYTSESSAARRYVMAREELKLRRSGACSEIATLESRQEDNGKFEVVEVTLKYTMRVPVAAQL